MRTIDFSYQASQQVNFPLKKVFDFFSDINNIYLCSVEVEHFKILEKDTAHWLLVEKNDLGIKFQPDFTLSYQFIDDRVILWQTTSGNLSLEGKISLESMSERVTKIIVSESVQFELPVSLIMSKIIKPIALSETRNEMKDFLEKSDLLLQEFVSVA